MKEALDLSTADDVLGMSGKYAAAFDLEVWKAQQKAQFRAQLRQAKEKLEREIHLAVKEKEKRTVVELENTRNDLEKLAKRLQESEQSLKQRTVQFEMQEAAFEERRAKFAEQYEMHLRRTEQRAKRTVEETLSRQNLLESQNLEKDNVISQLRERLESLESEYNSLKEKLDSCLAEQSKAHAEKIKMMELKFSQVVKVMGELKMMLNDRTEVLQKLWRENEELHVQLEQSKLGSETLSRKYKELWNLWYAREHELKANELQRLDKAVQRRRRRERPMLTPKADPLCTILRSLKAEVASYLTEPSHSSRHPEGNSTSHGAYSPAAYTCVERPLSTSQPSHQVVERPPSPPEIIRTTVIPRDPFPPPPFLSSSFPVEEVEMENKTGNTSTNSYPRVEVESWRSDNDDDDSRKEAKGTEKNEQEKEKEDENGKEMEKKVTAIYSSALPPLAPTMTMAINNNSNNTEISPSPEDFAEAAQVPTSSLASVRNEMIIFLRQLKINRQKLLDTGVYDEDHLVIKEMDEKIALYEQYLEAYH